MGHPPSRWADFLWPVSVGALRPCACDTALAAPRCMCVPAKPADGDEPAQPPRIVAGGVCAKTKGVKAHAMLSGVDRRNLDYILVGERTPRNIHTCEACRKHVGRWVTADKKAAKKKCTGGW